MRSADQLANFTRDALTAGKSRAEIADALTSAGWAKNEVTEALNAWADSDFTPPVPRPRPYVSAREAFFYGLMFAALGWTAWHLVALAFNLIDMWLPDAGDRVRVGDRRNMRFSIASLIVFAPLFFYLANRAASDTRKDPSKRRSGMRKGLGYLTLFLAALTLAGDLVFVLYSLLNGDLTAQIIAKAAVLAVIAGAIFAYFRNETMVDDDAT